MITSDPANSIGSDSNPASARQSANLAKGQLGDSGSEISIVVQAVAVAGWCLR